MKITCGEDLVQLKEDARIMGLQAAANVPTCARTSSRRDAYTKAVKMVISETIDQMKQEQKIAVAKVILNRRAKAINDEINAFNNKINTTKANQKKQTDMTRTRKAGQ